MALSSSSSCHCQGTQLAVLDPSSLSHSSRGVVAMVPVVGWMVATQKIRPHHQSCDYDLIWKKCLCRCGLVKDLERSSFWIMRWALNPKTSVLIRDTQRRDKKRRRPCEDEDKDQSYTATSQGMPVSTRSWKKQGRIVPNSQTMSQYQSMAY